MPDDLEDDDLVRLGVAANLARRYAEDQREFVEYLATLFEKVLPSEAEIVRRGGLFAKKTVRMIRVRLPELTYALEVPAQGAPTAMRTKVVRGIALKSEPLAVEEWLRLLGEHVESLARENHEAGSALRRILGG